MIQVLATITLEDGKRPEYLKEFHKLIPQVRAEQGCIEYGPAIDFDSGLPFQGPIRENIVVIIEKWSDIEALKTHLAAPHMKPYRDAVKPIVKGTAIQILEPA